MFTVKPNDLATKTNAQLAALFQEASKGLTAANADLAKAQSLAAMIRAELAKRGPSP